MFGTLFKIVNRRLWLRLLIPVSIIVVGVIFAIIWTNLSFQKKAGDSQLETRNKMLARAVEGGMFDALAIGDNDTVRTQFKRLGENIPDLKVFVYDFNGLVSFSTELSVVGRKIQDFLGKDSLADLSSMLEQGEASNQSFHVFLDGVPFLSENDPIFNEERCFHCHGENRKILGGISVFSSELAVKADIAAGKKISVLIGVAGLGVIVLFIWIFFHFLVNRKVHLVLDAASHMRQKDFTRSYDIGPGDEINHILARIDLVNRNLRDTIKHITQNSEAMFNSASDLSLISEDLNQSSTKASRKTTAVASAAEEMSAGNQAIASSMVQSTDTLNTIASAIEQMSATVEEIAGNVGASREITQQVVQGFASISQVVNELGERASDVDLVTDEIRSISEQVSMLALNAKIEAARAGAAGKGFAVVAQEITELANETNQSTLAADEKLRWIKEKSKLLTQRVDELTAIVKESDNAVSNISSAVEEQSITTREIADNINAVSTEMSEVNSHVTQGAEVAAEIVGEIIQVEDGSRQVQESSSRLKDNAAALSEMAENFMELMKKFKV